jgi:uncharacterized protein YlxW (UPF0749 family)
LLGSDRLRPQQWFVIGLITAVLGFLFAVQVRSQATAQKYLNNQDNVTLALLVQGLSQANNRLVLARVDLSQQLERVNSDLASHDAAAPALQQQVAKLRIVNGHLPVHGPGAQLTVGFALQAFEVQDIGNAFRQLGAEALAINGHRVTADTVIEDRGGKVTIDGQLVSAPYRVEAVGDPAVLGGRDAQNIAATLSPRGPVGLVQEAEIHITATVPERPFVYATFAE